MPSATVAMLALLRRRRRRLRDGGRLLGPTRVSTERPGRCELAELVPDHVLGHVERDELLPVVDGDRMSHHLRDDGRPARPGLDDLLLRGRVQRVDLVEEVLVDEWTLRDRTRHGLPL